MRNKVLDKIHKYWPDEDPQEIMCVLNEYGTESTERGRTRVQLAILKLSDGQKEALAKLVAMAKRDYRDVIAYAEYPEQIKMSFVEMRKLSPEEKRAVKKRDREQYLKWLKT